MVWRMTVVVCALAALPQTRLARVQSACAQATAPAVEQPPPAGEVLAPVASAPAAAPATEASTGAPSTIAADSPATAVAAAASARSRGSVKTASIKTDRSKSPGDSKDSPPDNSPFAGFENNSNHGPINIKSDTMSFDYKNNLVVFSGKVHAVQSDSELTSDTLHVLMNKQSQIQTMIADGNVRMSQGQRWATGDHAVLDENVHTLVLTGSPVVHDGKDQIAGTKITVFLQTNKSEVTDPKAVIFPRESKKPNNGEASAIAPDNASLNQ
jgi:lipopolysaccharide export system protein LptA